MTIALGAHCYIFTDRWDDASLPILQRLKNLGGSVLEIAVGDDVAFSPTTTARAARDLEMHLIVSPGGAWPLECDIASDDESHREQGIFWHRRQIELAARLGAIAYTGALYGHTGVVLRRRPPPAEKERVADGLRNLAEFAAERNVLLAIEPMSHFRTHLINTPAQAIALLDQVGHPNVRILFDTYHCLTEVRNYRETICELGKNLWGVHACENDRGAPGGGLMPWDQIAEGLREIQFAGPVMLEAYNSSLGDFAFERGMFHDVCPDPDRFVSEGFQFLREILPG